MNVENQTRICVGRFDVIMKIKFEPTSKGGQGNQSLDALWISHDSNAYLLRQAYRANKFIFLECPKFS